MFLIDNELKLNLIGGKGYKLIYFKNNSDLLIPNFKCVSSDFFDAYKEDHNSLEILKKELSFFLCDYKKYAVRSSAIDEDSNINSFAGIHESFLNVESKDVIDKIFAVYNSAFTERAINYRKSNCLDAENIKIAVVIQEMVDCDFAGVINTINPVTDNPDEIVISVVKGLGEDLVNGSKDGSNYLINGKNVKVIGDDILNKKLIDKLVEFTFKIISKTDRFQDIEFGIKNNKVYFLQTRDITVYNDINPHERVMFIDNSNIIESYYGQTSYLTYTFAKDVYRDVYTCTLKAGKVRDKILKSANKDMLDLILNITKKVLFKELDALTIEKIIKNTVSLLEKKENINIILSEKYARLLYEY